VDSIQTSLVETIKLLSVEASQQDSILLAKNNALMVIMEIMVGATNALTVA
jgi:hypothetical protein